MGVLNYRIILLEFSIHTHMIELHEAVNTPIDWHQIAKQIKHISYRIDSLSTLLKKGQLYSIDKNFPIEFCQIRILLNKTYKIALSRDCTKQDHLRELVTAIDNHVEYLLASIK